MRGERLVDGRDEALMAAAGRAAREDARDLPPAEDLAVPLGDVPGHRVGEERERGQEEEGAREPGRVMKDGQVEGVEPRREGASGRGEGPLIDDRVAARGGGIFQIRLHAAAGISGGWPGEES